MKRIFILSFFLALPFLSAHAATPDISIVNTVTASIAVAANSILPQALMWLGSFMALQFVITNFGLLKSGADIDAIFGKLIGSLAWFSFCFYLINNGPAFIDSVGNGILNKFAPNVPGPGTIITATLGLCTTLLIAIAAVGTSVVGVGNSSLAMVLVYVLILVFSIGMYMAIKVFMLTLELGLVVMLSPLSFSFLGLNALKDQGIAPLKSLISLVYRIILLGIIYAAFGEVISVAGKQLNDISWFNPLQYATGINIIFSMICAFPMLAYLVYKSDSIAASLAGGSSSMGPGDVASAAAMGAAAGAAAASGGVSAMGAATKPVQSMANFMQGLRGGGSVSNASSQGMGGSTSALPLSPPPLASMGSGGGGAPGAEAATPAFETNKAGAPMNPDPNAQVAGPANSLSGAGGGGVVAPPKGKSVGAVLYEGLADDIAQDRATANAGAGTAQTPSTGADAAATSSPTSPGVADTSLQSPPTGSSAGSGGATPTPGSSGSKAALIGAADSPQQGSGNKKTFMENLSDVGHHMSQEKAATHVSINTHHSD